MTPFMLAVEALMGHQQDEQADVGTPPATVPSHTCPAPAAVDSHLNLRAHAEQLVSEANAVLRHHGEVITLEDSCGPGVLAFTLAFRDRAVRVETEITGARGLARLLTVSTASAEGTERATDPDRPPPDHHPRRVATAEQLQVVLLHLLD